MQLHYAPIHLQPYYRGLGFGERQFPYPRLMLLYELALFPGISSFDSYWRFLSPIILEIESMNICIIPAVEV